MTNVNEIVCVLIEAVTVSHKSIKISEFFNIFKYKISHIFRFYCIKIVYCYRIILCRNVLSRPFRDSELCGTKCFRVTSPHNVSSSAASPVLIKDNLLVGPTAQHKTVNQMTQPY